MYSTEYSSTADKAIYEAITTNHHNQSVIPFQHFPHIITSSSQNNFYWPCPLIIIYAIFLFKDIFVIFNTV